MHTANCILHTQQSPPKGSDPQLPNCWHAQFTDKVRTTISAGADAVKLGVKRSTAAVCHGADAVKKGTAMVIIMELEAQCNCSVTSTNRTMWTVWSINCLRF